MEIIVIAIVILLAIFFLSGIRIVRPTQRGLIERLGKYRAFSDQGFHWIIPYIDRMIRVNITEQMIDAEEQEIITKDRLNAKVDAQIYYKVHPTEDRVKASQYNVNDYEYQIVNLCKTTLRNIIGNMVYQEVNSERELINDKLTRVLEKEAKPWGIEIVRTEMKDIRPPGDIQNSMNSVIDAENKKKAAIDLAQAMETEADGKRRAVIKEAEGNKQSQILRAQGEATAIETVAKADAEQIKVVNQSVSKYFENRPQLYKKLETAESSLKRNSKYIVPTHQGVVNVISEAAGITPLPMKKGN